MKDLQQLIDTLLAEKSKAMNENAKHLEKAAIYFEKAMAFDLAVDKARLLLKNTENENGGKKDASNDGKPM